MFNFFSKSKGNTPTTTPKEQIKHYAVKLDNPNEWYTGPFWSKVSSTSRPKYKIFESDVIGPFTSEKEAEEYCDRNNLFLVNKTVTFYHPQRINNHEQ